MDCSTVWKSIWKFIKGRLTWIISNLWYTVLFISGFIFVVVNYATLIAAREINAISFIALLWVVLLLFPIFSEFEFFGIKLKKELEKATIEIRGSVDEVKNQIIEMRINNTTNTNVYVGPPVLPDAKEIKNLDNEVEQLIGSRNKPVHNRSDIDISPNTIKLFKVRLNIEKRLIDICEKTDYKGTPSIPQMLQHAMRCELIPYEIFNLTFQVYRIASRGVHGEIVGKEYMSFVDKTYPLIIDKLHEVQSRLTYVVCRKCGYHGYARQDESCPNCGEINLE